MAYLNKVKSNPSTIDNGGLGINEINIGVNSDTTYGGSPYTGWYNALDIPFNVPESIVMYKANSPIEGVISPGGSWTYDFTSSSIPFSFVNSAFTIECWVLFNSFAQVDICEIVVGGTPFRFRVNGNGTTSALFGGTSIVTSSSGMSSGVWNHIAITRNLDNKINLYINGLNVGDSGFSDNIVPDNGRVDFFKGSGGVNLFFTNLRVVTKTSIYPTESVVGTYPQYPLNRSYDDTALLVLGKKESNYRNDYSVNNAIPETDADYYDVEVSGPLKKIIDATMWEATPWNVNTASDALINLINGHPARFGQPYFTGIDEAVEWAFETTTSPIMFSNMSYYDEDFGTPYLHNCSIFLDTGNISSYPLVRSRHYNLRQYDTYATVSTSLATWSETRGGVLVIQKTTPNLNGIQYDTSSINFDGFCYFGVIRLGTFTGTGDVVGMYGGNQNWRVVRVANDTLRLYITDGAGTEIGFGNFSISSVVGNDFFGLTVSYNDSSGQYVVFVNNSEVMSGVNPLSRVTTPGSSKYLVSYNNNDSVYHYVSALWTKGTDEQIVSAIAMAQAFSNGGRYTGIA